MVFRYDKICITTLFIKTYGDPQIKTPAHLFVKEQQKV